MSAASCKVNESAIVDTPKVTLSDALAARDEFFGKMYMKSTLKPSQNTNESTDSIQNGNKCNLESLAESKWTSDVHSMEYSGDTQHDQRNTLLLALGSQEFSDITFLIGEQQTEFHLNRMFLAMISPVFKAMLYGQMREAQADSEVIIEDMASDIFECIIHFAYCNDPKITSKNVLSVLTACDKYQITKLNALCFQFFKSDLDATNFADYFRTATRVCIRDQKVMGTIESYFKDHTKECLNPNNLCLLLDDFVRLKLSDLIDKCSEHLDNVSELDAIAILDSEAFLTMSSDAMSVFLGRSIQCQEERIWEAMIKWDKKQRENMNISRTAQDDDDEKESVGASSLLKSLRHLIRFGLMDGEYFTRNIVPMRVLTDKEMIEVFSYRQYPNGGCGPFNTNTRKLGALKYELLMSSKQTLGLSAVENTWESLQNMDLKTGCTTGDKSLKQYTYVAAAFDQNVQIYRMELAVKSAAVDHWIVIKTDKDSVIHTFKSRNKVPGKNEIQRIDLKDVLTTKKLTISYRTYWKRDSLSVRLWKVYGRVLNDKIRVV